eukprot:3019921-Amphidinium_carterae.1
MLSAAIVTYSTEKHNQASHNFEGNNKGDLLAGPTTTFSAEVTTEDRPVPWKPDKLDRRTKLIEAMTFYSFYSTH